MGVLDILRAALPAAAAARGGYLQGQMQEEDKQEGKQRQSVLDQMKQALDQSTIDENKSRQHYYDAQANAKSDPPDNYKPFSGTEVPTLFNPKTGEIKLPTNADGSPLAGKSKNPTLHQAGVVNPSSKMVEDIYSDGSRKTIRPATPDEIKKATHVPRDGDEPPPMTPAAKEEMAGKLADSAVKAVGGDPVKAMEWMEKNGEYDKAKTAGMTRRHYYDAAERFKRSQNLDNYRYPGVNDPASSAPPPAKPKPEGLISKMKHALGGSASPTTPPAAASSSSTTPPGNYAGAPKSTTQGDIKAGDGDSHMPTDREMEQNPRISKAVDLLRSGKATLDQLNSTKSFTPDEKAIIKRLSGAR